MALGGEEYWYCPFCQKQTIKVFYNPKHKEVTRTSGTGTSGNETRYRSRKLIMLSEKCSNCGKTKKEIEPLL
jgi:hypothetical protein